jgi:hypothetical protein
MAMREIKALVGSDKERPAMCKTTGNDQICDITVTTPEEELIKQSD